MYAILFLLHVLAATVWTGGHIVLSVVVLPRVLRERDPRQLLAFESVYEKIGMPALLIQVATGLWLAYNRQPDIGQWLNTENLISRLILAKLLLLALTVCFALDARFRVVPSLTADRLTDMAWHIIPVTVISVLFVVVGVSFRTGGFY